MRLDGPVEISPEVQFLKSHMIISIWFDLVAIQT